MDVAMCKESMGKILMYVQKEYAGLQAGRATTGLVEDIAVETNYGVMLVGQIANITLPDHQSIKIEPWDKGVLKKIEKAIYDAERGLTPRVDDSYLIINIPPLTKERREAIAKQVKKMGEDAKAKLRTIRQDARDTVKANHDHGDISEDQRKAQESNIDDITKDHNTKIDILVKNKTDDVMNVS